MNGYLDDDSRPQEMLSIRAALPSEPWKEKRVRKKERKKERKDNSVNDDSLVQVDQIGGNHGHWGSARSTVKQKRCDHFSFSV